LGTLAGQLATAIEQLRAAAAERQWLDQLAHSNDWFMRSPISPRISKRHQGGHHSNSGNGWTTISLLAVYDQERSLFTLITRPWSQTSLNKWRVGLVFH
jgi:hypothetical protein